MNKKKFSTRARINSFRYAYDGIVSLIRNEHNSRIHLTAGILVIILGLLLHLTYNEWVSVAIVTGLVFITELINSAIEKMADLLETEVNQQIKVIKDYAAASVLIAAILAVVVGGFIFIPGFIEFFRKFS
jgi:diacylglycerol kinase